MIIGQNKITKLTVTIDLSNNTIVRIQHKCENKQQTFKK